MRARRLTETGAGAGAGVRAAWRPCSSTGTSGSGTWCAAWSPTCWSPGAEAGPEGCPSPARVTAAGRPAVCPRRKPHCSSACYLWWVHEPRPTAKHVCVHVSCTIVVMSPFLESGVKCIYLKTAIFSDESDKRRWLWFFNSCFSCRYLLY